MDTHITFYLLVALAILALIVLVSLYWADSVLLRKLIAVQTGEDVPQMRVMLYQNAEISRVWGGVDNPDLGKSPDLVPEYTNLVGYYRLAAFYGHNRDFALGLYIIGIRTFLFMRLIKDAKRKAAGGTGANS